jgi:hypothetical protein
MNKMKSIIHVVKNGNRASEWGEAGLLRLVEWIIDHPADDFSSKDLQSLIEQIPSVWKGEEFELKTFKPRRK